MNSAYKILLVDDDSKILNLITNILSQNIESVEVFCSTNVNFALEIIKNEKPDLIISDWVMPQLSGLDLMNILHSNTQTAIIPIIICTGIMLKKENLINALNNGAIEYIKKPVDEVELLARVNSILRYVKIQREYNLEQESKKELETQILEERIALAEKEISTRVLMLSKYNEVLKNTAEQLKKLAYCKNEKENKALIADIITNITNSIFNENWENMIISFEKLYPSFFTDLSEKYPNLTKNETKLCALLKLGLSTKEISSVTMQSQRAIEMARFRLRNKLNLSKNDNFQNVFNF